MDIQQLARNFRKSKGSAAKVESNVGGAGFGLSVRGIEHNWSEGPRMLDTIRRSSEQFDKRDFEDRKEKNYNQIFMKGPELTKNIWERMHLDAVNRGFEEENGTKRIVLLTGLLVLFLSSLAGIVIFWFTNLYINSLYSMLVVSNGSQYYDFWMKPSPKPHIGFYIFNYTNARDFEDGIDDKLKVEELGPYVYEETFERYNINFNEDDTVSYQIRRKYKFVPELSKGWQSDRVLVPNVPLLGGASRTKYMNFFLRFSFSTALTGIKGANPFIEVPVHKFITGYSDDLYEISKSVLKFENSKTFDKFGLLAWNMDKRPDVLTMSTGAKDINKIARLEKVNDDDQLHYWSTDECNSFKAAEGQMYPPPMIKNKKRVKFFIPQFCRSLPLDFEKEVTVLGGKIPAYRYKMPADVFESPNNNVENQCFCNMESGDCPPRGVFNATPCAFGVPMYFSFPHFFGADDYIRTAVEGLRNDTPPYETYQTYGDLHPEFGYIMNGKSRFQVNVQVQKSNGISQLSKFEDGMILPLSWFEASLVDDDLTEDLIDIIYQTTFTSKNVEKVLKYGCLLTALVISIILGLIYKKRVQSRSRASSSSTSPLEIRQTSIE